ncbi:uncharacterized protein G2W53_023580 [Senna tora]|uniref:Uncharacterized protein n=1 Tax=Senna tora TaxID=362788 RepID=A0A834TBD8_9FABA|nr:uncharacterized protein G2W53_023580 [Senna tora]
MAVHQLGTIPLVLPSERRAEQTLH